MYEIRLYWILFLGGYPKGIDMYCRWRSRRIYSYGEEFKMINMYDIIE